MLQDNNQAGIFKIFVFLATNMKTEPSSNTLTAFNETSHAATSHNTNNLNLTNDETSDLSRVYNAALGVELFSVSTSWSTPVPVAALSKAWICDLSNAGIAGSIPTTGMEVCLL
jgi:hypothetical protein